MMTIVRVGCWAAWLALATSASAISEPPVPIWPADGKIPESLKDHYVFLTPDLGTVVIALPSEEGSSKREILRLTIHNRIRATVRVDMKSAGELFRYEYLLFNTKASQDGITTFYVVASQDPNIRTGASWPGGPIRHSDAKRVGLSGAPNGRYVMWSCPLKDPGDPTSAAEPLEPGSSARFALESVNRPGFTTAFAHQWPPFEISSDWPEQVILQASLLQAPDWIDKHVITLGPRYAPEFPARKIAADYLSGMGDLTRDGRLDPNSRFIQETTDYLKSVTAGQTPPHRAGSRPGSRLEREIEQGLDLCFGLAPEHSE